MLPAKIAKLLMHIPDDYALEELRIRAGQPLQLCAGERTDRLLYTPPGNAAASFLDCQEIFERVCAFSVYAWEDELKNGFVTLQGGYRVGICGRIVRCEDGSITYETGPELVTP